MDINKDQMTGKLRKASDVILADKIMWARKKGDKWLVIEMLVEAWSLRFPDEQKAIKIDIKEQKADLRDAKFGTTSGGTDMERRLTMIFPIRLQQMVRTQYSSRELPFDRKFYQTFLRKFPMFQVPEKI